MSGGVEKVLLDKFVDKLKEVEIFTDNFSPFSKHDIFSLPC